MKDKLKKYIEENMIDTNVSFKQKLARKAMLKMNECTCESVSIDNYINQKKDDNNFQKLLFSYIDRDNLKDSDVYNKVHIDRRLFSKIRSDSNYHPSKETVILLGFSLELSLDELLSLLESASYSLPRNNYFDLIIRFCFEEKIYKITDVNNLLDMYKCNLFNY